MKLARQEVIMKLIEQGFYTATTGGEIISHRRGGKIKKQYTHPEYSFVTLCVKNRPWRTPVHHFIFMYFKGWHVPSLYISHMDGNKKNNDISNLALSTAANNLRKTFDLGKRAANRGVHNVSSKLNTEQVEKIRNEKVLSCRQLAKQFGVGKSTILRIIRHQSYA